MKHRMRLYGEMSEVTAGRVARNIEFVNEVSQLHWRSKRHLKSEWERKAVSEKKRMGVPFERVGGRRVLLRHRR